MVIAVFKNGYSSFLLWALEQDNIKLDCIDNFSKPTFQHAANLQTEVTDSNDTQRTTVLYASWLHRPYN